ncbi:MAG: HAD hydrolase-like protein [Candidatus Methanomethylicia archaeon]
MGRVVMDMSILVLDFDGVITSLNIDWFKVLEEASMKIGFKVKSLLDFWEKYFGTREFYLVNEIVEKYEMEAALKAKPFNDVKIVLENFRGKIYLASMQSEKVLKLFLEKHDLEKYFKEVLGRERFSSKVEQLKYILKREEGETIVFVDDSKRNILMCQGFGVKCILIDRKKGDNLINLINSVIGI